MKVRLCTGNTGVDVSMRFVVYYVCDITTNCTDAKMIMSYGQLLLSTSSSRCRCRHLGFTSKHDGTSTGMEDTNERTSNNIWCSVRWSQLLLRLSWLPSWRFSLQLHFSRLWLMIHLIGPTSRTRRG